MKVGHRYNLKLGNLREKEELVSEIKQAEMVSRKPRKECVSGKK